MNRIISAFTFDRQVYAEVKHDAAFTSTAWVLVVVANFLGQIGANALDGGGAGLWIRNTIIDTLFAVVAFYIGVVIIHAIARQAFKANASREALFRTLGLASVWSAVGVLGVIPFLPQALFAVISAVTVILGLAAALIAAKEALELEWFQVGVSVIVAWVVSAIVAVIVGLLLALF